MVPQKSKTFCFPELPMTLCPPLWKRHVRYASQPLRCEPTKQVNWSSSMLTPPLRHVRALPPSLRVYAYLIDRLGPHYDATAPTELECAIISLTQSDTELDRSTHAMMERYRRDVMWQRYQPYYRETQCLDALMQRLRQNPKTDLVMLVDQPLADPTVGFSLAGRSSFETMRRAAIDENPDSIRICVMDPFASGSRERSYLGALEYTPLCVHLPYNQAFMNLMPYVKTVYTVNALLGFDALLDGKRVECFGAPFYAGWGCTHDRFPIERRAHPRSTLQLFEAFFIRFTRYFARSRSHPLTFEEALNRLERSQTQLA